MPHHGVLILFKLSLCQGLLETRKLLEKNLFFGQLGEAFGAFLTE